MIRRLAPTLLSLALGVSGAQFSPALSADGVEFDSPETEQLKPAPNSGFASDKRTELPEKPPASVSDSSSTFSGKDDDLLPDASAQIKDEPDPPLRDAAPVPIKGSAIDPYAPAPEPKLKTGQVAGQQRNQTVKKSTSRANGLGMVSHLGKAVIDAPGAMYRRSVSEFHAGVKDFTNNSSNRFVTVPATILSLPFCTVAGCVQGLSDAFHGDEPAPSTVAAGKDRKKIAARKENRKTTNSVR